MSTLATSTGGASKSMGALLLDAEALYADLAERAGVDRTPDPTAGRDFRRGLAGRAFARDLGLEAPTALFHRSCTATISPAVA